MEFSDLFNHATSTQTVYNQILDWLTDISNDSNNVNNIALNIANRAQDRLWRYKDWDYLVKDLELSGDYALDSDYSVTLPDDFGRIMKVGYDSDNDGKMDFYFYKGGDVTSGYKIRDTFTKAAGHSFSMTFFRSPSSTITVVYQAVLTDFTASGTEYSYFPGDLLFAMAKKVYLEESPMPDELNVVNAELNTLLMDYVQKHQYVNSDMRAVLNDEAGDEVDNISMSLDGESGIGFWDSRRPNDEF